MSKQDKDVFAVLHQVFEFWRIMPEVTIITSDPTQALSGRLNRLSCKRPRFVAPKEEAILSIHGDGFHVKVENEAWGLEGIIFAIIYAVLYGKAYLKGITVVHKTMESLQKAAEEDLELFGKFDLGHCLYNEVNLQHGNSPLEGFQARLAGIKDPKQVLQELTSILGQVDPPLEFKTNEAEFYSTGVITIPIDTHHQVELYLEKAV